METFIAHSAQNGHSAQTYEAHIRGVLKKALKYAMETEQYSKKATGMLTSVVKDGAVLHDLGKLDDENQEVLQNPKSKCRHLPINHTDAGSAALISADRPCSALLVYSHHRGLPDFAAEKIREEALFRDDHPATREHVNKTLENLLSRHHTFFPPLPEEKPQCYEGDLNVFFRMALSCLADADHSDTAIAYGQASECEELPRLRADERLKALDQYISELGTGDERDRLRGKMYESCRNTDVNGHFSLCDSPVGSGKTTAVMAHLLRQAAKRNARRIFVVLPYTSIIEQSVNVYRRALVLPGEKPDEVVAELHSKADFDDYETHYLTALWRAPIIVTTAVAFFETLSSCRPSALRRLHELPGSVVFLDEAHNALPIWLLPLAWRWMNVLADEWSCYWVLASGSLVRYWELGRLSKINMAHPVVSELVDPEIRERLAQYEQSRVAFRWNKEPMDRQALIEKVQNAPGPRLLIMNTIRNAAVIAADISKESGRGCVEHLSTALTSEDRKKTIERIKQRLADPEDTDWTLVATSCVEAGMDFSFRTGFREMASLLSLLQSAGRVNRHGKFTNAEMWSFSLQDDSMLNRNEKLECSVAVLRNYFAKNTDIVPGLSTHSMNAEIIRDDNCIKTIKRLLKEESDMQFDTVDKKFKVIDDDDAVIAVVDESLAETIKQGRGDWRELQKKSVSIYKNKSKQWNMIKIKDNIYRWTAEYDTFLGYMSGVLKYNL